MSIITAPASAPQRCVPAQQPRPVPRLDDVDRCIVESVRDIGPVKTWSLFNWLAEDEGRSRANGREARRALWERVRRLKRLGLVFGHGRNELAAVKPDRRPTRPRPRPRRRKPTVPHLPRVEGGSEANPEALPQALAIEQTLAAEVFPVSEPEPVDAIKPAQTKTGGVTGEQASEAGRLLAKLPRRRQRRWTGWLHGQHFWRGRRVVLPNGEVTGVCWTSRGRVLLTDANDLPYRSWVLRVARRERDIRLYRHPAAVKLGSLKRGRQERPSTLKAASARRNGAMPCRPGRRRGRPPKLALVSVAR